MIGLVGVLIFLGLLAVAINIGHLADTLASAIRYAADRTVDVANIRRKP